jgi:hypothetical protein
MSRHPVDLFSFVSGLLVLTAGLVLLSGSLDQVPLEWVGPFAAIGLGVVIAIAARPARDAHALSPDAELEPSAYGERR